MTNVSLLQKAKDAVRYGVGVCLTPVAVLGVAGIALVVFVADRFGSFTPDESEAANAADAPSASATA
ncbi:hypothetical protein C1T17_04380 [Sphingobium sp. SCG-1]|uniref:hypothetical protein n=1 Tax=Sphingobium sp. SCG-1 TaxID=2072936 RepID=UPI000CD6C5AD|nr:hypothetical protein [Sphingobium sp. SCG-1]AUW57450.1 hypothetical protein C1T17_04380 [Sphingobium sp. SCG-1]